MSHVVLGTDVVLGFMHASYATHICIGLSVRARGEREGEGARKAGACVGHAVMPSRYVLCAKAQSGQIGFLSPKFDDLVCLQP